MDSFTFMLAPIEDMSSNAFRTLCYRNGADLTFTEMVRVAGLARKNTCTWGRLSFNDDTPTVIQLIGAKENWFKKFLSMFEPHEGFKGFNLNLGCPDPDMIKLGQGCALARRISKTKKLVQIFRDRGYPISVKLRLGLNEQDKINKVYLNLIDGVDADFFVVHARHGGQTYGDPADHSVFEECVKTGKDIIANGDIRTKEHLDYLKSIGVKGVMIGRQAVLEPSVFNRLKGLPAKPSEETLKEYMALAEKYKEPFRYRKNIANHSGKERFDETLEH